jgi:putative ABC transport system permease protein
MKHVEPPRLAKRILSAFLHRELAEEVCASVMGLLGMLSREFIILVAIACLIAVPVSYQFMSGWLVQYQYRTDLTWMLFAWVIGGAITITLLTVLFQALKAALSNPVESICTE